MKRMSKAIKVAISCGDLNGIGLETLAKVFSDSRMFDFCIPVLYANKDVFTAHKNAAEVHELETRVINSPDDAQKNVLNIIEVWKENVSIQFGEPDESISKFTITSLKKAAKDVIEKRADALVTLPINKDVISNEDFPYKGHTEFLRDECNAQESLMFLVSDNMRVGLITNHLPIHEVSEAITQGAILKKMQLMNTSLQQDFGIQKPKIAVLGLNPHAGDNGLIGTEEHTTILPAIDKLMQDGLLAVGPYSADGFFGMAMYTKYDAVMAMYHDQGLLPFKMISFDDGVNFTAGLSIVRTSPDHGTAYDIAGMAKANPESLRNAIFKAGEIVQKRQSFKANE